MKKIGCLWQQMIDCGLAAGCVLTPVWLAEDLKLGCMGLEYFSDGHKYSLRYRELREQYRVFVEMSDEEFMENIIDIAHFAVFVCFIKEEPSYLCLSDTGIVHELIHLMKEDGTTTPLGEIRDLFNRVCKIC